MPEESGLVRIVWECPLCGARRSSIQQTVDEPRGRSGLLNHIRHTDDDDHGEWRAVPEDLSTAELDAYLTVEPVALESQRSDSS
jgi:hypothetical protein